MDKSATQSIPAKREDDRVETLVTKRMASGEPSPASDAKRVKISHDWETKPDVQPPRKTVTPMVPFPEKVGSVSLNVRERTD